MVLSALLTLIVLFLMHFTIGDIEWTGKEWLRRQLIGWGKSSLLSLLVHCLNWGWCRLEKNVVEETRQFFAFLASAFECGCMCHQSLDMRWRLAVIKLGNGGSRLQSWAILLHNARCILIWIFLQLGQAKHTLRLMDFLAHLEHFLTFHVFTASQCRAAYHDLLAKFLANRMPARSSSRSSLNIRWVIIVKLGDARFGLLWNGWDGGGG